METRLTTNVVYKGILTKGTTFGMLNHPFGKDTTNKLLPYYYKILVFLIHVEVNVSGGNEEDYKGDDVAINLSDVSTYIESRYCIFVIYIYIYFF